MITRRSCWLIIHILKPLYTLIERDKNASYKNIHYSEIYLHFTFTSDI